MSILTIETREDTKVIPAYDVEVHPHSDEGTEIYSLIKIDCHNHNLDFLKLGGSYTIKVAGENVDTAEQQTFSFPHYRLASSVEAGDKKTLTFTHPEYSTGVEMKMSIVPKGSSIHEDK